MRNGNCIKRWVLLLATSLLSFAQTINPFPSNTIAAEEGRKLYLVSCAPCHGRTGEGGQAQAEGVRPPDLTRGVFKSGPRDEDLFRVISKGIPGSEMPGFEPLGSENLWRLVAFIRMLSRATTATTGNAASGEALFQGKGNCTRCHQIGTIGFAIGPDLTRGSRRSTPARLKRSIVTPDEEVNKAYAAVTVVTRDQKTYVGIARYLDDFSVRLIDLNGNERTFLHDEIASMQREMRSLMPSEYSKTFNASELDDLVAYIIKLRN